MTAPQTSIQLYTIHDALDSDLDRSIGRLAEIGFRHVEAFDFVRRADQLKTTLDRYEVTAPTAHAILVEDDVATPDGLLTVPSPEETFAAAAHLGVQVLIDPFIPAHRWGSIDDVHRIADRLNERAARAAEYGLTIGYHNHDHELTSLLDGRTALEVFADRLSPEILFEVDLYWAAASGQDVPELINRLGKRVFAVHVKDGAMRPGITSANLPKDQVPAGQGDVPLRAAIDAATSLQYAVIEFDHYEGDVFAGVAESFAFLTDGEDAA